MVVGVHMLLTITNKYNNNKNNNNNNNIFQEYSLLVEEGMLLTVMEQEVAIFNILW